MTETSTATTAPADLAMVNLDCADPAASAAFYARLMGWEVVHSQDEYAMISGSGTPVGFGRVDAYVPPAWPDMESSKRFHLDLHVDDLDEAAAAAVELGASVPGHQPGVRWRVLLDPAGHPFCLCPRT